MTREQYLNKKELATKMWREGKIELGTLSALLDSQFSDFILERGVENGWFSLEIANQFQN